MNAYTFVCGSWHTFHDGAPLHDVVVGGPQVVEDIVLVGLVCLQLRHQPLDRRGIARRAGHDVGFTLRLARKPGWWYEVESCAGSLYRGSAGGEMAVKGERGGWLANTSQAQWAGWLAGLAAVMLAGTSVA